MNSKERVNKIFDGEIPDRPAIGFFAIDSDIASKILKRETYWRAKAKSQIAFWQGRRDEVVQSWIEDGIELYKKLDIIDIVPVCTYMGGICPPKDYNPNPPKQLDDNTWQTDDGKVYRYSPVTRDLTVIRDDSSECKKFEPEKEMWDGQAVIPDESVFEVIDAFLKEFSDDRFVLGLSGQELAWFLPGGFEKGFMELASQPEVVKEVYLSQVAKACEEDKYFIRQGQSGIMWGTDLACQSGPMMSPAMYKDVFLDGFKQRISSVHSHNQKVVKHMCGNNWTILDLMVEAGIDCYQSIQASAGMEIVEVHDKYNDKFVCWGGLPVEQLIEGTPEQVKETVNNVVSHFMSRSRYIFGTSHSVAVGTKYDNFMAMMDELDRLIGSI